MPAIEPPTRQDFSDTDIERLDELLRERALPHGGLSLEALDGFFSALIIGPEDVPASEYLTYVWGEEAPAWDSNEVEQEATDLLGRLWNHIAKRVKLDPEKAEDAAFPLLAYPEDAPDEDSEDFDDYDYPVGADWAAGFLLGADLRGEGWEERIEQSEELAQDFADLESMLLHDDEDDEQAADGEAAGASDLGFRQRMAILGEIPYLLHDLHQWRAQEQLPPQRPTRREEKPDRNGPCPCGSGKKFKKCCGDPARLH